MSDDANRPEPRRSGNSRRRKRKIHGFHVTKRRVFSRGLAALDGRSALARSIRAWKADVVADMGGPDNLSRAQATLIDAAARDLALLEVADAFLLEQGGRIVDRTKRAFVPLVEQRLKVMDHLGRTLAMLGLKRVARPVQSLAEVLASASRVAPSPAAPLPASEEIAVRDDSAPGPSRSSPSEAPRIPKGVSRESANRGRPDVKGGRLVLVLPDVRDWSEPGNDAPVGAKGE
jgi:hypothetical protein